MNTHTQPNWKSHWLPDEVIYADDCDFIANTKECNNKLISIVTESLLEDNLNINDTKTEHKTLK